MHWLLNPWLKKHVTFAMMTLRLPITSSECVPIATYLDSRQTSASDAPGLSQLVYEFPYRKLRLCVCFQREVGVALPERARSLSMECLYAWGTKEVSHLVMTETNSPRQTRFDRLTHRSLRDQTLPVPPSIRSFPGYVTPLCVAS